MTRADEFRGFAEWAEDYSRLYERLTRRAASDEDLLSIAAVAPEHQLAPNLLLGAVHDLLLAGADHRIAEFYGTCVDDPVDPDERDPYPAFREFCLDNEAAIRERVASRLVQTNEVGRSAVLYPSFARVASAAGEPLGLVELGPSAGLNMRWDSYRYVYGDRVVGNPDSPVTIEVECRGGDPPLPADPPAVADRVGVDLNPLDVTDPEDARWLRALVLPNQEGRHERLAPALDAAAADPPDIVAGDAAEELPKLLEDVPDGATPCVYSTIALYQFPDETVDAIRAALAAHSESRPVHWLSGDPSGNADSTTYRHARFVDGEMASEPVAEFGSYGSWLDWSG